uniref:Macrophage-expressed gene 1 protein n=1 Tax=Panagrolaimus davidi TaxID=227884 RepID=A0A914PJX6_9BILA
MVVLKVLIYLQCLWMICFCKQNYTTEHCSRDAWRKTHMPSLDGRVGSGYDNLQNVRMSTVFQETFNECRTTPDGDFYIPDFVKIIPRKHSEIDRVSSYYGSFKSAFEQTTETINIGASASWGGLGSISGSYSQKYQETKQKMVAEKSSMFHTKILYEAYDLIIQPGAPLDPAFVAYIDFIDDAINRTLTGRARYLSESAVAEFGTHYIKKAVVGAKIEQYDYVESNMINSQSESLSEYKASIAAGFQLGVFGGSMSGSFSYSTDKRFNDTLSKATRHSQIKTFGGPTINRLLSQTFSASKPAATGQTQLAVDDIVALDVDGEPLETFSASLCDGYSQVNGITGALSCPAGFDPIFLFELRHQFPDKAESRSYRHCSSFLGWELCNDIRDDVYWRNHLFLNIYWCKAKADTPLQPDSGYMFGGLFAKDQVNPFTNSPLCPDYYQPFRFGFDVTVCLSRDYQLGRLSEVKFGGFFSCEQPVQHCDDGYSQHLITKIESCEIYYCVPPKAFIQLEYSKIKRPPFEDISVMLINGTESVVDIYVNNTFVKSQPIYEILKNATKQNSGLLKSGYTFNATTKEKVLDDWLDLEHSKIEEHLDKVKFELNQSI